MRRFSYAIAISLICHSLPSTADGDSTPTPAQIIEQALAAIGGLSHIEQAGGVQLDLSGEFDLSTRLQGRSPFRSELTPITEHISIDYRDNRLAYDIDWYNYHQSQQQLREIYDSNNRVLFIDRLNRNGGWLPFETVADPQQRLSRMLPQLLLADALQQHTTLDYLNTSEDGDAVLHNVRYTTSAGDSIDLSIDRQSLLLKSASSHIDMPLLGNTQISWHWLDYSTADDRLLFPNRLQVYLGDKLMKSVQMEVNLGFDQQAFAIPEGITVDDPPQQLIPASDIVPYGQRESEVEQLAPGVFMVINLRPGFRLLFVEFDDYVMAIDAPTGWYEMQQIPPMNWSQGDSTDSLGDKYLRAIKQTIPDKPVRYLVLTHHHSDHIGGLLPFVKAGATVIGGQAAVHMARRAVAATPDKSTIGSGLLTEIISGEHVIKDHAMEVQLVELPDGNPKADNYLMVYLPRQKILYATAFIYPVPEAVFPPKESIPLSRYFVEWLDNSSLETESIYNVHAMGLVEPWQLEKIRQLTD